MTGSTGSCEQPPSLRNFKGDWDTIQPAEGDSPRFLVSLGTSICKAAAGPEKSMYHFFPFCITFFLFFFASYPTIGFL